MTANRISYSDDLAPLEAGEANSSSVMTFDPNKLTPSEDRLEYWRIHKQQPLLHREQLKSDYIYAARWGATVAMQRLMRETSGSTKPPPGLTPRSIVDAQRTKEICEAINRYRAVNKPIPIECIEEYCALNSVTQAEALAQTINTSYSLAIDCSSTVRGDYSSVVVIPAKQHERTSFIDPTPDKHNFPMRVDQIFTGNKWFKVTEVPKGHPTLRVGDNVQCIKEPYRDQKLLYRSDGTTHSICHGCDYVYVVIVEDDQ